MDRQALHPCGMDSVLLLRDLPPAADPAAYLLSLTSCDVQVSHVETSSGVVVDIDPLLVSVVQAVPSTFSFSFENMSGNSSGQNGGVVVNPRSASAELNVVFDFSMAMIRLEQVWQEHEAKAVQDSITTQEEPVVVEKGLRQYSTTIFHLC